MEPGDPKATHSKPNQVTKDLMTPKDMMNFRQILKEAEMNQGQEEPEITKPSYFFKNQDRNTLTRVTKAKSSTEFVTVGQYHPDEWQLKKDQIWIDTVTKKGVIGYKQADCHRFKDHYAY